MRERRSTGSAGLLWLWLALLLGVALAGQPASAQSHGPPGFDYPAPDGGRSLMFGGSNDDLYWSWFEIGPDVCAGEEARIVVWVGGRRFSLPCAGFVHARVAPGRPPKNWGLARDPIRAESVSAVLGLDPPALLTLEAGRERNDRRLKDIGRILATEGICEALPDGFRACRPGAWPETRRLVVHPGLWLRDGLPLHMVCEDGERRVYCELQDVSPESFGRLHVAVAFETLDAEALALVETLYALASDTTAEWLSNR